MIQSGVFPYVAMMQVAAADTHANYVICRGFDIRHNVFVDYAAGNSDKPGIPVAKPYGRRRVGAYWVGQIFPAILPMQSSNPSPTAVDWRVGQNPGVSATSSGHPADLTEAVEALKDDDDEFIDWMVVDEGLDLVECCLSEDHPGRGIAFDVLLGEWDYSTDGWTYSIASTTAKAIDWRFGVPYPETGAKGLFTPRPSETHGTIYECVSLDCESSGACVGA